VTCEALRAAPCRGQACGANPAGGCSSAGISAGISAGKDFIASSALFPPSPRFAAGLHFIAGLVGENSPGRCSAPVDALRLFFSCLFRCRVRCAVAGCRHRGTASLKWLNRQLIAWR